jgi:hypothetical protein
MANYVLEILDGDRAGEVLPVGNQSIRIGRKTGNDIVLADEKTSGVHCEISPEGDRFVLKDLGSTNGTFLDGKRVSEVVLTPGDVVTCGRLKVQFRNEADSSSDADAGEFAMRKIDAGRLQKRGSSMGLVALLVILAAGGGGWFWFQGQQQSGPGNAGRTRAKEVLSVSGNRLSDALASCESDEGWRLRVAGIGFQSGPEANSGRSSFSVLRTEDESEGAAAKGASFDFAVMQLAEPVEVFAGRVLTLAAHCQTSSGGQVALRARLYSSNESVPFRFCNGTKIQAYDDGWQRIETVVTVPSGCDRMLVEVVAVLPSNESEALVDDIAVTEGGEKNGFEYALSKCPQTAFGFGSAFAVRSSDAENSATILALEPGEVPTSLSMLNAAGYCVLSDLGSDLSCEAEDVAVKLSATGVENLKYVMPLDAAGGLMVADAGGKFAPVAAQSEFKASSVLFGSHATRALLQLDADHQCVGVAGGGLYRLSVASPTAKLVMGFRSERQKALRCVRDAEAALTEGLPGLALNKLSELMATVPMTSEELASAQRLRSTILNEQSIRVDRLKTDLEQAGFFDTRGGFERVASSVDELILAYGEVNLEDVDAVRALRAKANERLVALDQATYKAQRDRLTMLADAFGASQQLALQKIVKEYITTHLPAVAGESSGEGETGNKD